MYIFLTILGSFLIIFVTKKIADKIVEGTGKGGQGALIEKVKESEKKLESLFEEQKDYATKSQIEYVAKQIDEATNTLQNTNNKLQELDNELNIMKKNIDEKEIVQQELKASKEQDERELEGLLSDYEKISGESCDLEKKLAVQISTLDDCTKEGELTNGQRDFLITLNETLEESAGNLRTLITEYEQMTNRITLLKDNLADLEAEYTKLVEKQLDNSKDLQETTEVPTGEIIKPGDASEQTESIAQPEQQSVDSKE